MTARPPRALVFLLGVLSAALAAWAILSIHPRSEVYPPPAGSYLGSVPVRGGLPFALHNGGVNAVCIVDRSASVMPPLFRPAK